MPWWPEPALIIPSWLAESLLTFAAVALLLVALVEAAAAAIPEATDDTDRRLDGH